MTTENKPEVVDGKAVEVIAPKSVQITGPLEIARSFKESGLDMAMLKEMIEMQHTHDAYQAKKAFIKAMAKFKTEPIRIIKDKENKQYGSKYSSIGATVNACLPRMGECGLSHKWEFVQKDTKIMTGKCIVTHEDGFSDSVSMDSPLDISGNKNPIQQIKSTRTYIKIETFSSLMGLASAEDLDDDGAAARKPVKLIDEKQLAQITDMINSIPKFTEANFLSFAKLENVEDMPVYDFQKNMNALEVTKKAKEAKE